MSHLKTLTALAILAIASSPFTLPNPSAAAKSPRTLAAVWALQPTCGNNKFEQFGAGSTTIDDPTSGYKQVGNDPTTMAIALFKQSNGEYIVGVNQNTTVSASSCFLRYRSGKWQDVSRQIVPNYSPQNYYEVPRQGTTVTVFALVPVADLSNIYDKGPRKGSIIWRKGKFAIDR